MRTPRVSTVLAALAAVAVMLLPGTPAWAHNQLLSCDPARDATLKKAPEAITLTFAQKLNPDFTTVVLSDAAKQRVTTSAPQVDTTRATIEVTAPLAGGNYTVAYRVVSVDGHVVQGSYGFQVAAAAAPFAPASSTPSPAPAAVDLVEEEPAAGGGMSPATLIAIAAAAIVVVAAGAVALFRTRRR
ncbi:copper resistance CopC family protein [Actinoplanes sp. TFC3]|uniref:copper resistance CopC family protein n=1 Tax=Actinoplanes sp. TFC3 TaxID=1710355 RepID=UPI0008309323|nr:copper resistance CopC family protein [Actinoplanes sp. TFC3]